MYHDNGKLPVPKIQEDELLDRVAAAKYIGGIKPQTLAVWHCKKRYDLKPIKIGSRVRYKRSVLDAFINDQLMP